jgi:hypothetical protein
MGGGSTPILAVDGHAGRTYLVVTGPAPSASDVAVLDNSTGRLTSRFPQHTAIAAMAVDPDTKHLFVAPVRGPSVRILDSRTGAPSGAAPVQPYMYTAALAVASGRLYVAGARACPARACSVAVQVFDTRTGMRLRRLTFPTQIFSRMALAVDPRAGRLVVVHAMLTYTSTVDVNMVDVLDLRTGRLVHETNLPPRDKLDGAPVVDPVTGRTFLVVARPRTYPAVYRTADHAVLVFDTRTGRRPRTVPLSVGAVQLAIDTRTGAVFATTYGPLRTVTWAPAPGAPTETTLVPAAGSGVRVLNPYNAAVVRYIRTGTAATAVAVDSLHGWVYVATAGPMDVHDRYVGPGTVSVVDEHTASVVRQVRVPANPIGLILDTRHQRLLVAAVANGPDGTGEGTVSVVATTRMTGRRS